MKSSIQFQNDLVQAVQDYFNAARKAYAAASTGQAREEIRATRSAVLLEAPTGVGKTYMAARSIGQFSRNKKMLWFWFSPWEHLAEQTEAALRTDARGLQVADLEAERQAAALAASRVYSLVWASVAARGDVRRRRREADDGKQDLETFIAEARALGYEIGVVVDEAHHGVRGESEASRLLKDVLKPDYFLFLTATPDDQDVLALQRYLGLLRIRREVATRDDGIEARLIKPDVKLVLFDESYETGGYLSAGVSLEAAAIKKAVTHHEALKSALAEAGIERLTPLLLVQVGASSADAEANAKAALEAAGIPAGAIRVHTSNQPDKDLQTIADDQSVEALVFKMAVATGFNAPRAFTLVSTRTSRSEQFGLQVLGRILRVPARLRAVPKDKVPELLKYGYVFLVDKASQDGLTGAAARIKEIEAGVVEYATLSSFKSATDEQELVESPSYQLRPDLALPQLLTQTSSRSAVGDDLEEQLASQVNVGTALLEAALQDEVRFTTAALSAFEGGRERSTYGTAVESLDASRIARRAMAILGALPETDLRELLQALLRRMASEYRSKGMEEPAYDRLLRAVHLIGQIDPRNPVREALQGLYDWQAGEALAQPLPSVLRAPRALPDSERNVYGVVPLHEFDSPDERRFALNHLEHEDAPVLWWHRNPARKPWSIGLAKPTGGLYYPDFLVCVDGLETLDSLALIEVKGEGWLTDAKVAEDFDTKHPQYGRPIFVTEVAGEWYFVKKQASGELAVGDRFSWKRLRNLLKPAP